MPVPHKPPYPRGPSPLRRPSSRRSAATPAGTNVNVGGIDQTLYMLNESLTLRLNSFDFGLVNPPVAPALGDIVHVLEPAWTGTVVSVHQSDPPAGTTKFYAITATNTDSAYAAPAPFGLSDTPDLAATYPYVGLSITKTRNDTGDETKGTCTIFTEGLWPGMTFTLTSANFGLSATQFSVSNVTVSWPTATSPVYDVEFGDTMVELSTWINTSVTDGIFPIDSTKITDGSVTTPKLAANAVTAAKIAAGTITSNEIAAGTITTDQLAVPQPGGQNVVLNSGFELADFSASVDLAYTWTLTADWTGSHVRAATNTTEGNSLTMTGSSY